MPLLHGLMVLPADAAEDTSSAPFEKILVQNKHAGAMLQRNRRDQCINRCQAHTLGAPQPENRRSFPVGPEATRLDRSALGPRTPPQTSARLTRHAAASRHLP